MNGVFNLTPELLHYILTEVNPPDLACLTATCRSLQNYIRGNKLLHKELHNSNWDAEENVDFEQRLHDIVRLEKILASKDPRQKESHLRYVVDQVERLLRSAKADVDDSENIRLLSALFSEPENVEVFLTRSETFQRARLDAAKEVSEQERQLSAKLHCLYGVPITELSDSQREELIGPITRLQSAPVLVHPYARSKVYDLRNYTDESMWGPFQDDGSQRVDWEKVEAIMLVLGHNFKAIGSCRHQAFPMLWRQPFIGAIPFVAMSDDEDSDVETSEDGSRSIIELQLNLDAQDPYDVTGTWMRVVCFLDYTDLYHFNFRDLPPMGTPRPPITTEEAVRLILMKWRVTKIVPAGSQPDPEERGMDWSNFQGTRLPIVHFAGTSRSLLASWDPDANSRIRVRGTVRQTPEGEIRWTTFSIFHGEERWRSESVQVGGLRSARGVLGHWFDKDKSDGGPAGPTAFWKQSDLVSPDDV